MIIFAEGFGFSTNIADYTSYKGYVPLAGGPSGPPIIWTGGPLGDNYFGPQTTGQTSRGYGTPVFGPIGPTFTVGLRAQCQVLSGNTSAGVFGTYSSAAVVQLTLGYNTLTGLFTLYRGDFATVLGTFTLANYAAWNYFELQATLNATTGSATVRVNGVVVLSLSGINTAGDPTNLNVSRLTFTNADTGSFAQGAFITHIYVTDQTAPNAGFLGDVRVYTQEPTANAAVAFTPAGLANNFQNAAKTPPAPITDFNSSSTAGQADLFTGSAVPLTFTDIFAVGLEVLWGKSDSGARTVASEISSSATIASGATITPVTAPSFAVQQDWFQTDPHTGASWLQAAVNAVEFGYKVVT